jgi:hypothetical protein
VLFKKGVGAGAIVVIIQRNQDVAAELEGHKEAQVSPVIGVIRNKVAGESESVQMALLFRNCRTQNSKPALGQLLASYEQLAWRLAIGNDDYRQSVANLFSVGLLAV